MITIHKYSENHGVHLFSSLCDTIISYGKGCRIQNLSESVAPKFLT